MTLYILVIQKAEKIFESWDFRTQDEAVRKLDSLKSEKPEIYDRCRFYIRPVRPDQYMVVEIV